MIRNFIYVSLVKTRVRVDLMLEQRRRLSTYRQDLLLIQIVKRNPRS